MVLGGIGLFAMMIVGFFGAVTASIKEGPSIAMRSGRFHKTVIRHGGSASVAHIDLEGIITASPSRGGVSMVDDFRELVEAAVNDHKVKTIVIRINSPGGSPVQSGIINDEIRRLKALHKKPVYVVVEETCASAAYYIAVAADQIFVDKASVVGSIGVLMDGFGFTGLMDKLGVERRLMTAGVNKGFLDPFSPQTKQQRTHAQTLLDQIHQQFIQVVRDGRGKRSLGCLGRRDPGRTVTHQGRADLRAADGERRVVLTVDLLDQGKVVHQDAKRLVRDHIDGQQVIAHCRSPLVLSLSATAALRPLGRYERQSTASYSSSS